MNRFRKFLAIFLSVVLMTGVCVVPTTADIVITDTETVEKYISLLDLAPIAANTSCTSGLPVGLNAVGVSAFNPNWALKHTFDGTQEIVRVNGGPKSWKLNFTTAMANKNWLNDISNEFSIRLAVPTEYVPYITAIKADLTNGSAKKLCYKFGITDGTHTSCFDPDNSGTGYDATASAGDITNGTPLVIQRQISSLYKAPISDCHKPTPGLTEQWATGDNITYVYLVLVSRGCTGTEGGFVRINDIGITITTTEEVVEVLPEERTYNLFDLSNHANGTLTTYPEGVYESKANGRAQFAGNKIVYTKSSGKKALKLDLASTTFSYGTSNLDKILQGEYNQVYAIKLKIPAYHVPFITKIALKYEKQSTDEIIFNIGVSDGTNYSKAGTNANTRVQSGTNGEGVKEYNPATLNITSAWQAGAYGGSSELWGSYEYRELFLWVTCKPATSGSAGNGYFSIDEVTYTILATDKQIEEKEGYINGFENKIGVETPYAAGGARAFQYDTGSGTTTSSVNLTYNPKLPNATGLSFWIYNPTSTNTTYKICLKGSGDTSYVVADSYSVPANSSRKVTIDFAKVYTDTNPSNPSGYTQGSALALNASQIAALTSVTFMCRQSSLTVYCDDFWLIFGVTREGFTLPIDGVATNVLLSEQNKVEFQSSSEGSDIEISIPVPNGAFKYARSMTFNFDFDVPAKFAIRLLGTNDSGNAAHWKWGYKEYYKNVTSPTTSASYTLPFAGYNAKYNTNTIHEGTGLGGASCQNCTPPASWDYSSGHNNTPPSTAERASIHTILVRVFANVGTEGQKVTLNSITYQTAFLNSEGEIQFNSDPSGSDITARIPVIGNALKEASTMTLNMDFDVAAKYSVTLLGTNDQGKAAHWKWGYKEWSKHVTSPTVGHTYTLNFAGYPDKYNHQTIHEGTGEGGAGCNNCRPPESWGGSSGHNNTPPTPSEKASIHTILIRVFENTGTDTKVTLNSLSITNTPNSVLIHSAATEHGQVFIDRNKLYSGEVGGFQVLPDSGYYVKSIDLVCSNSQTISTIKVKDGANIGNYYNFVMPMADLTIKVIYGEIDGSVIYSADYVDKDDVNINFTIPMKSRKAYNTTSHNYLSVASYGVIVAFKQKLSALGINAETLTLASAASLKAAGGEAAYYIYLLEDADPETLTEACDFVKFTIKLNDISIADRRAPLTIRTFVDFADSGATDYSSTKSNSIDKYVYGPAFTDSFVANVGINYADAMQSITTTTWSNRVFALETWQDIRAHGFDHVRMPVKLNDCIAPDGKLIEEYLVKLDKVIEVVLRAGMSIVVDLHGFKNFSGDYSGTRPAFLSVWDQLAVRYAHMPLSVAFELINEPHVDRSLSESNPDPLKRSTLMKIQEDAIAIIRGVTGNEQRKIAISTHINMVGEISTITSNLRSTPNLILDIHFYSPMSFSHSGATWITQIDPVTGEEVLTYPAGATNYNVSSIENCMVTLNNFRSQNPNFIVWLGEWGAFRPNYQAKLNYYSDITYYANQYNIARAIWDYSAWGPYSETSGWNQEMLATMF